MYTDLCGKTKLTSKSLGKALPKQKGTEDTSVSKQTVKVSEEGNLVIVIQGG